MKKTKLLGHSFDDNGMVVFRLDRQVFMKINYTFLIEEGEDLLNYFVDYFIIHLIRHNRKLNPKKRQQVYLLSKYRDEFTKYIEYVWFSLWDRPRSKNYMEIRFGREHPHPDS